jgi:hypothetical protein
MGRADGITARHRATALNPRLAAQAQVEGDLEAIRE